MQSCKQYEEKDRKVQVKVKVKYILCVYITTLIFKF